METTLNTDCKTPETTVQNLPIEAILYDQRLQMRDHIDPDHVDSLCQAIEAGETLPPIDVFEAEELDPDIVPRYYIGDGNHRYLAAKKLMRKEIACRISSGGRDAAMKRALGANAEHNALRRTNADKRKSVICALALYPKASLRELAEICKVTHQAVAKIKKEVSTVDTHKKGKSSDDPRQLDWYEDFLKTSYKPFETKFLDVINAPIWMNPQIPATEKLKTCKQVEEALRRQIDEIKKREEQIKTEIIASKGAQEALPESGKEHA